jgi:hypothetical protein
LCSGPRRHCVGGDCFARTMIKSGPDGRLTEWAGRPFGGWPPDIAWDGRNLWALDAPNRRICIIRKSATAPVVTRPQPGWTPRPDLSRVRCRPRLGTEGRTAGEPRIVRKERMSLGPNGSNLTPPGSGTEALIVTGDAREHRVYATPGPNRLTVEERWSEITGVRSDRLSCSNLSGGKEDDRLLRTLLNADAASRAFRIVDHSEIVGHGDGICGAVPLA